MEGAVAAATLGNSLVQTDMPLRHDPEQGRDDVTQNIIYVSGRQTWKERILSEAAQTGSDGSQISDASATVVASTLPRKPAFPEPAMATYYTLEGSSTGSVSTLERPLGSLLGSGSIPGYGVSGSAVLAAPSLPLTLAPPAGDDRNVLWTDNPSTLVRGATSATDGGGGVEDSLPWGFIPEDLVTMDRQDNGGKSVQFKQADEVRVYKPKSKIVDGSELSDRALATTQSRPLATTQSRPLATTQSRPLATTQSRPLATTQSRPLATTQSQPPGQPQPSARDAQAPATVAQDSGIGAGYFFGAFKDVPPPPTAPSGGESKKHGKRNKLLSNVRRKFVDAFSLKRNTQAAGSVYIMSASQLAQDNNPKDPEPVDIGESGEGSMEISIKGPSGGNVQNHVAQVAPGQFAVNYTPMEHGAHKATVLFNKDHVPGSPVDFAVIDASHVTATGEGLGLVPCHKAATFSINAPGAKLSDLDIKVTGPDGRGVPIRVSHAGGSVYAVEYTPVLTGEYRIDVRYFDQVIGSSPFTAKAWDASKVLVSNITPGRIGKPSHFQLDASRAGQGNLEIVVSVGTENVPNFVKAEGNARFDVSFTPQVVDTHNINVRFNGELVPGSPFQHHVIDGGRVTASGDGLRKVPANKPAFFEVLTQAVGGEAPLQVDIAAPSGRSVPSRLSGSARNGYLVEYTPVEVGFHRLTVLYADVNIRGSPFEVEVYDPSKIRVGAIADGVMGQPLRFDVDASAAGTGQMTVEVHGQSTKPRAEVTSQGGGRFGVAFVPHEVSPHQVHILFNGHHVPGSPFPAKVFDWSTLTLDWDAIRRVPVKKPVTLTLDAKGAPEAPIEATVFDPYNRTVVTRVTAMGTRYQIVFTPINVGPHTVNIQYGGQAITGSPFTCNVFDAGQIKMSDVTKQGLLNQEMGFTVDVSQAGQGALEVELTAGTRKVALERRRLDEFTFRFTFMPLSVSDHVADVIFNYERVPGSPLVMTVFDSTNIAVNWDSVRLVPVNKAFVVDIDPKGAPDAAIETNVRDPNGKQLPVQVSKHGHIHQVVVTPLTVGPHVVTLTYGGQAVPGSPCTVSAYDTALVRIHEASTVGAVKQDLSLTVDASKAGTGTPQVEIKCQGRLVVAKQQDLEAGRWLFTYQPIMAGQYVVDVTFNGHVVPDSPVRALVFDPNQLRFKWDYTRLNPLNKPVVIDFDQSGVPDLPLEALIIDPQDRTVARRIEKFKELQKVTFTPTTLGPHKVTLDYGGHSVPGSPFICHTYDVSLVKVTDLTKLRIAGEEVSFTVDIGNSGYKGEIKVEVTCEGQVVQLRYFPLDTERRRFTFVPLSAVDHVVDVTLCGERPQGLPFPVSIVDFGKVAVDWDGARSIPFGSLALVTVDPQGFPNGAVDAKVSDSRGRDLPAVVERVEGKFNVEFNPHSVGTHTMTLTYCGQPLPGSPHKCHVYDFSKTKVTGLQSHLGVSEELTFIVDLTEVGDGELAVEVLANGRTLQMTHQPLTRYRHQFAFTPRDAGQHYVEVRFNKERVPRSPFTVTVYDVSDIATTWEAMRLVPVNKLVVLDFDTHDLPDANVDVQITDTKARSLPSQVRRDGTTYKVEFVPLHIGLHNAAIQYGGQTVPGSPFQCDAFDPARVRLQEMTSAVMAGKEASFIVDIGGAGRGQLAASVVTDGFAVNVKHSVLETDNLHRFTFVPASTAQHCVSVTYNDLEVPGSPLNVNVYDTKDMVVSAESARLVPVGRAITVELDPRGMPDAQIEAKITDPLGRPVQPRLAKQGGVILIEFTPLMVGSYSVDLRCVGQPVPGSPFLCKAYDPSKVRLDDVTHQAKQGDELGFTVDTSEAGPGELEVEALWQGQVLQAFHNRLEEDRHRFTFSPGGAGEHLASIKFNGGHIPNTPLAMTVEDPGFRMFVKDDSFLPNLALGMTGTSTVEAQGAKISLSDVIVRVTAPNGELVPAKIVQQPDGDYKVEYSSRYTGRHTVEILYAGQAIMGSPFFVEIYDPNKIRVEGTRTGMLGTRMEFDIIRNEAGRAELGLSIVGPSGRNVPYEMTPIAMGDHVTYMPVEVGPHHIHITYGGLDVPGCPIRQEILDVGSAVASGDGLVKGIENRPTTFLVDTKGRKGNLDVQVDGPNSIAKCNIDPEPSGRYVVTYIPVEVGSYNVTVKWNGREIEGSPFHPKVVDPTKVLPVGGWETLLDAQGRMHLKVHDRKTIQFETIMAGPGEMRVELQGPDGLTPVEVERRDSRYYVHFTPRMEGDYYLRVLWCGIPLPRCPLLGMARGEQAVVSVNHEKVVLTGHGLLEARVREEADFVIDGTEAGPGTPTVKLSGVKCDIDVRVLPIGANKYKCVYVPQIPGAYLLNIMWSDRQVRGSPFKVNVVQSSDASKVMASGEGLKGGIFGKEIKAVIDTRRAGPGELTAHCMGPVKVAFCELHDHHDGTFTLSIKPQEAGKHILQVKYGGEHVPGSPFLLRVAGAPDASKVRVSGPGIEHGILATYQSRFIVETRGAGAGQLTVRIRGPKGAFRVEMQRESQKDRTILCRYEPQEVGDYIISVKWSGDHVPGSPIHVQIFDTQEELERFMVENPARRHNALAVSDKRWTEDI